jgi:hypothetical protein
LSPERRGRRPLAQIDATLGPIDPLEDKFSLPWSAILETVSHPPACIEAPKYLSQQRSPAHAANRRVKSNSKQKKKVELTFISRNWEAMIKQTLDPRSCHISETVTSDLAARLALILHFFSNA